jgi:cysteinyl-tRNA synthetase
MSTKYLGNHIDIHTGGVDNIFPHHENEIAQSECATGEEFVKYWMHNEHLMVDGKKMAKSSGNFYTLRDIASPISFRYWLYTSHYKTKVNFTMETLKGAETALNRLIEAYRELGDVNGTILKEYKDRFIQAMDMDLNTPQAIAILWDLVKDKNVSKEDKKATMLNFDKVFGFGLDKIEKEEIPDEILSLIKERNEARENKDWDRSDEIRGQIENLGFEVKDTEEQTKVFRKSI